jgi:diphosphomevalonate decarboxylase
MVIAVVDPGSKPVGSTEAMNHTRATSPYYEAWVKQAAATYRQLRDGVLRRDIGAVGDLMEHSALAMHASMLGARPYILYLQPASLRVVELVRMLRDAETPVFFTMDAGPQVKLLTLPEHADQVRSAVAALPGVVTTLRATPGPDARVIDHGREA